MTIRLMGKVLLFYIFLTLGFSQITVAQTSINSSGNSVNNFQKNFIVLKFKTPKTPNGRVSFSHDTQLEKLKKIIDYVDHHQIFANKSISNARSSSSALQNIYRIRLKSGSNIWNKLARLNQLDFIEYAEPLPQNELLFIPNDPQADPDGGLQDYLTVIKAYEGWQIDQSDSSMVIGIVDTGVNMNHEDLGNIAFNYADPINGVDDDGDGYIDNFYGWDLADNDYDPTADGHPHGTPVAGMSSASTNNGIGMAGIGFKSKYLPVKIAKTSTSILTHGYAGIVYAADHGCKVINLSWGSAGSYSKYAQDVINYAVLEKDVVVVAAAGNTHEELNFYPASYDNVLSVGASDINDNLAPWATYSHFIDIMAPGDNVFSTKNNGGYEKTTGSSFAAPLVAGAAALVRSHFPEMSALQVMEQLRVTSDNIYSVGSNMDFYGQLGRGRLNVQRALSDILTPSIRLSEFQYESNHGKLIFPGDTVNMLLMFTNYLRNAENITITISNPSANVSWEIDQIYIDKLGEFESYQNNENPISFIVNPDVPPGERLLFRIDFVGNNYT
ncbi:MAG: S8 family serine peptidase, partial [Cyclobacteriaceae bacterium]|nr:S8 family serine peptidase [Cyclobacteriaceae bacterium]